MKVTEMLRGPWGLLQFQHSEPKNRVEVLQAVERPHSSISLHINGGSLYAQDFIGSRTNSLDDCCSDQFES